VRLVLHVAVIEFYVYLNAPDAYHTLMVLVLVLVFQSMFHEHDNSSECVCVNILNN